MALAPAPDTEHQIKWGKVIDNERCIGCHACTVACKAEHLVPLGVTRTYVKQVDVGTYPAVSRHFQVTRCNQCENPPCVPICPTTAMFRRKDGIVDFDKNACIGCKACIAACPYDAIYIDPDSHSAEKCNFCAHRIDQGMEPACVAVCPEQAIIIGDLNDPVSQVSRILARQKTDVRKPEKGTGPKLFYVGASEFTLSPGVAELPVIHAQSEQRERYPEPEKFRNHASAMLTYDVPHGAPWGVLVSLYTWTKSLAAGAYILPAALSLAGVALPAGFRLAATVLSAIFLVLTGALLVGDLKHPERFLLVLLRPQWRSWLARGAYTITGFGAVLALDFFGQVFGWGGLVDGLRIPGILLAAVTAMYTAFLFAQARARDLWQNPVLPLHLLAQAGIAGAAGLLIAAIFANPGAGALAALWAGLMASLGAHLLMVLSELVVPHMTRDAGRAARHMTHGYLSTYFWGSVLLAVLPLLLAVFGSGSVGAPAVLALLGLLAYEHAYVSAGQSVPLS